MAIPQFILDLRVMVGHHRLWLPGVSGVVRDADGRVLLGRRSDTGAWAVPSGILEPGEQPEDGLLREIEEETGVHAEVVRLVHVHSEPETRYPNGDVCQYLSLLYECRYLSGQAHVADDESLEVAWFAPDSLPELPTREADRLARVLDGPSSAHPPAG